MYIVSLPIAFYYFHDVWDEVEERMVEEDAYANAMGGIPPFIKNISLFFVLVLSPIMVALMIKDFFFKNKNEQ